jgi:hypothetical protein
MGLVGHDSVTYSDEVQPMGRPPDVTVRSAIRKTNLVRYHTSRELRELPVPCRAVVPSLGLGRGLPLRRCRSFRSLRTARRAERRLGSISGEAERGFSLAKRESG